MSANPFVKACRGRFSALWARKEVCGGKIKVFVIAVALIETQSLESRKILFKQK